CKIYENQDQHDWFILNLDDANVVAYATHIPAKIVTLSLQHDADLCVKNGVAMLYETPLFEVRDLKIVGTHNVYNAIIAAAMAYLMETPLAQIQQVLHTFTGVKHRLQFLGTHQGVSFYNDSKATNPEASATALQAFESNIILLAGGYDKHLPFDLLKQYDARVKCCIGFGATNAKVANTFTRHQVVNTLEEAFEAALALAQPNDVILLAPACASFDQFTSFEQRGDRFIDLVEQMKTR
ncbi:MAG: glutamate ligase domain-containing protein, partial [Erysipelotrichaceae bacterium]